MKYIIPKYTSENQVDKSGIDCFIGVSDDKILYFSPNRYRFKTIKPYKGKFGNLDLDLQIGDNKLVTYKDVGFVDGRKDNNKDYNALQSIEELEIADNDYLTERRAQFIIGTHENLKIEKYNTNFVRNRTIYFIGNNKLYGLETEIEVDILSCFNLNDDASNYQAQKWIPKQKSLDNSHKNTKYFDFINYEKSKTPLVEFIYNFNNVVRFKNIDKIKFDNKPNEGVFATLHNCYSFGDIDKLDVSNIINFKEWFYKTSPNELPV